MGQLRKLHRVSMEGEDIFRRAEETGIEENGFVDSTHEDLPICIHGCVIHNQKELGGRCLVCYGVLCHEHLLRCSLDGNRVCRNHVRYINEEVICTEHGVLRLVVELLSRS